MEKASEQLKKKVRASLEKLRPYLQSDGGDVKLIDYTDDHVVKVKLMGACNGCPFSMQTLKAGIEMALKREIPEIKEVVSV